MQIKSKFSIFYILFFFIIINNCAHPVAPTGGEKDTTPPKLDSLASSKPRLTNFSGRRIELTFDEWVRLENPNVQIVISPPLQKQPNIYLHGKTLRIDFDKEEVLHPNTTYSINFGNAVKDLTEGNIPANLNYVFSTGNDIDSLSMQATLVDAYDGKPMENALLLLYENTADTAFRKNKPYYFAKTNKEGFCKIENIKAGTFRAFALKDGNNNYRYDQATELIGFADSLLIIKKNNTPLQLRLFEQKGKFRALNKDIKTYGKAKIVYNQTAESIDLKLENKPNIVYKELENDTLTIWYHEANPAWSIIATSQSAVDTSKVTTPPMDEFLKKNSAFQVSSKQISLQTLQPKQAIQVKMQYPITKIDEKLIALLGDSLGKEQVKLVVEKSVGRDVFLKPENWREGKTYRVLFLPNALQSIFGTSNKDSIALAYRINPASEYGSIQLSVGGLNAKKNYAVQLLSKANGKIVRPSERIKGVSQNKISYDFLEAGEYEVIVFEDDNDNKAWDAGNYEAKQQPEVIKRFPLEALRKNWELEASINWR